MKFKKELNTLRNKVETASTQLHALSDEELEQVKGGYEPFDPFGSDPLGLDKGTCPGTDYISLPHNNNTSSFD